MKKLRRFLSLCLMLTLVLGQFPLSGRPVYAADTNEIAGVTPVGTTIDLFDYWVYQNSDDVNLWINTAARNAGINRHGDLKFSSSFRQDWHNNCINAWTGREAVIYSGIVQNKLGPDNYPWLASGRPTGFGGSTSAASLGYLFNYDDTIGGKRIYPDVHGLFQVDNAGYFSFDSNQTSARLNSDGKTFSLSGYTNNNKGFYPFSDYQANYYFGSHMTTQFIQSENGLTDENIPVTYEFTGDDDVWIFIDGVLVGDVGGIHGAAQITINFADGSVRYGNNTALSNGRLTAKTPTSIWAQYHQSGLGAADHYYNRTVIVDTDGGVTVIKEPVANANAANYAEVEIDGNRYAFQKTAAGSWIFADDTYHTLDFFYLERGAGDSNMQLKFNLEEIPPTYIQKVDQDGQGIADVEFELYAVVPADGDLTNWTVGEATTRIENKLVATGITDADGNLTLRYSSEMGSKQGKLASLADIFTSYKDHLVGNVISSSGSENANVLLLELVETEGSHSGILANYRRAESSSLRLQNINGTYILRSNERWNKGVYASPNVIVSAPKMITLRDGHDTQIDLSATQENQVGLFGVVLAWIGESPPTADTMTVEANWAPVYGGPEEGWTICYLSGDTDYAAALGAAIADYTDKHGDPTDKFVYPFALSASGSYNTVIDSLPGEIDHYYFMVSDNNGNITNEADFAKVQYTTSFYYSTAAAYADMDEHQTHRVNHRNSSFQRDFGSTIGVPNIENRLMVQRLDAQGSTLIGAEFSLYRKEQVDIAADGTVTLNGEPLAQITTEDQTQGDGNRLKSHINANGVGSFEGLAAGEYYVMETEPPAGYAPNSKPVHVVVDAKGVHAYAGGARTAAAGESNIDVTKGIPFGDGDGISVLLGVGNLVSTMSNFGSTGHIDTTLTDIYALRAKGEATAVDGQTTLSWTQIDPSNNELQRKWRVYDPNAAMQYATFNEATDYLGRTNPLSDLENPYGYVSASGWNWDLISQNYYGIYDPGKHYSEFLEELSDAEKLLVEQKTRSKTALPTTDYKAEDDPQRFDISDGYTSFGNMILNGLFSGSTAVRVAATAVGDLVIGKQVVAADDGGTDLTKQFGFSVGFTYDAPEVIGTAERPLNMIGDIDLAPQLAGDYAYIIRQGGIETETGSLTIAAADGVTEPDEYTPYHIAGMTAAGGDTTHFAEGKLKLAGGETITIIGLPRGTAYTVTEDNVIGYQQAVNAEAATDVTDAEGRPYTPTAPAVTGMSVSNTIAVPGQTDTLIYTNTGDSGEYPYTVNYLELNTGNVLETAKQGGDQPYGTLITAESEIIPILGYKYHSAVPAALTIGNNAAQNVITLYYETDPGQTKNITYTVEYYQNGTLVEDDTQSETVEVQVLQNEAPVDQSKINTTDKYPGYRFDPDTTGAIPTTVTDGEVISIYYVTDDGSMKNLTYTVEYYRNEAKADADTRTETIAVQVLEPDTITVNEEYIGVDNIADKYFGYACIGYRLNVDGTDGEFSAELADIPRTVASGTVIKIYYEIDEDNRKDITYTVNYYKDGELAAEDTQTETVSVQVLQSAAEVDKTKINITDKYPGYNCTTMAADIPDTIADGGVINVYYVRDDGQTKVLSYTVEYYRDGAKVSKDTQTVSQTVHVSAADTLTVDKTAINTKNKYPGYYFSKSVPAPIPDTVTTGAVIKIYYVSDSSGDDGGGDDDDDKNKDNTPGDLNITDHIAYVIGYPDGNVRPEASITRAEAATIFFRLLTDEARAKYWRQTNAYNDVTTDMWCNNAISTLSRMGIISGDPDGAFRPNDPITRAELAKISVGFFDTKGLVQSVQTYADVPTGEWYARYVAAAELLKLVEGYPDDTFRPNNKITRAETCTMVNRILGRAPHADHLLADKVMLTWPDNPKQAWYYTQIQEATNSHDYRWIRVDGKHVDEWTARLKERSWADLEKEWSDAYDAPGKDVAAK